MIKIFLWDALNESFHKKKSPKIGDSADGIGKI